MAQTLIFLREQGIESTKQLEERTAELTGKFNAVDGELKRAEERLTEIAALKKHLINYAKTREIYADYRRSGYSKKFFEAHRETITLHKSAKDFFNQSGIKKLPKVKELNAEYEKVLAGKKAVFTQYREVRAMMREVLKAKKNVEQFLNQEEQEYGSTQKQKKEIER